MIESYQSESGDGLEINYIINDKTIGSVNLILIYNPSRRKCYGYIEDLYVEEDHRNKGIGKELIENLIKKAKTLGCYKIIATSRFPRENVHKFYEDLGLEKWGYEFRMDL